MQNKSIPQSAARLRLGVIFAMSLIAALYLAARFGLSVAAVHVEFRRAGLSLETARLLGDGTVILLLVALAQLARMLGLIAAGELFTARVIGAFRRFALWLMLMALFGFVAPMVAAIALASSAAAAGGTGPHRLELMFDLRDLLTLGITLVLFLLARLLERASELEAEVREFV